MKPQFHRDPKLTGADNGLRCRGGAHFHVDVSDGNGLVQMFYVLSGDAPPLLIPSLSKQQSRSGAKCLDFALDQIP